MKFKKKDLQSMVWHDSGVLNDKVLEEVEDDIVDTSRWSEHHAVVFSYKNKYYQSYYSKGLTECQEEDPYEKDGDEIECTEVHQVEKMVKVWESV